MSAVIRLVLAVGVLVVLFAVVVLAARRGWRGRAGRQTDIAEPPRPPAGFATADAGADGAVVVPALYVSSTRAGDWLDRVVVHGLGVKSRAVVTVLDGSVPGLVIDRSGAPDLFIPAGALHAVRRDSGIAGKVAPRPELVVLTWDCGGVELDTGVRPGSEADRAALAAAAAHLIGERVDSARSTLMGPEERR